MERKRNRFVLEPTGRIKRVRYGNKKKQTVRVVGYLNKFGNFVHTSRIPFHLHPPPFMITNEYGGTELTSNQAKKLFSKNIPNPINVIGSSGLRFGVHESIVLSSFPSSSEKKIPISKKTISFRGGNEKIHKDMKITNTIKRVKRNITNKKKNFDRFSNIINTKVRNRAQKSINGDGEKSGNRKKLKKRMKKKFVPKKGRFQKKKNAVSRRNEIRNSNQRALMHIPSHSYLYTSSRKLDPPDTRQSPYLQFRTFFGEILSDFDNNQEKYDEFFSTNCKRFPNRHRGIRKEEGEKIFYYEVTVYAGEFAIGLAPRHYYNSGVGWYQNSVAFHGDDGAVYNNLETYPEDEQSRKDFTYNGGGSVIGCGYNSSTKEVFFTKNGKKHPYIHRFGDDERLYPTIGGFLGQNGVAIIIGFKVNIGEDTVRNPFRFLELNVHESEEDRLDRMERLRYLLEGNPNFEIGFRGLGSLIRIKVFKCLCL